MVQEKMLVYLNEIDKKNQFVGLGKDVIFKSVVQRNPDILEEFLKDLLNLKLRDDESIIFLDKELIKGRIKEKGRIVDVKVRFGKNYLIQIEINSSRYENVLERNDLYLKKIDTLRHEINDKRHKDFDTKYLYQVNLNTNENKKNKIGYQKIVDYDIINNKIMSETTAKFAFNLDYYYNLYYNGDINERSYSEIFLASMKSKNYTEQYKILSNILPEDRLNKFMEDMINMTNEDLLYNIHYWEKEKMDALVEKKRKETEKREREELKKAAIEEGRVEGREEGREEGRVEGIESSKIEIIKNMLMKKYDYLSIADISGKTIEEIKAIEKTIEEN